MQVPLLRLQCGVNSYEWGKKGESSAAARFAAATPREGLAIDAEKPYAEVNTKDLCWQLECHGIIRWHHDREALLPQGQRNLPNVALHDL